MAVRFYKELNELSTADFYSMNKAKHGKYHEVERTVSRRVCKHEVVNSNFIMGLLIVSGSQVFDAVTLEILILWGQGYFFEH